MSEKTVRLLIDLTYDPDIMHGDDEDSIEWFNNILFGDDLQLGDFGDLGDMIGSVKVIPHAADRIEELEDSLSKAMLALDEAIYLLDPDDEDIAKETGLYRIVTTYAELKGNKND